MQRVDDDILMAFADKSRICSVDEAAHMAEELLQLRGKLQPCMAESAKHLRLIEAGYRTHHVDGSIVWMELRKQREMKR